MVFATTLGEFTVHLKLLKFPGQTELHVLKEQLTAVT